MADPVTLGVMAAGTAVSAAGTLFGGASADAAAKTSANAQYVGGNAVADAQETGANYSADAMLVGGELTAKGQEQGGVFAEQDAEFQAKQAEQAAAIARASGQRDMFDVQRQTKLTSSTLQANAAASGGGASDENIVQLQKDIAGRGEYEALIAMFNGENTARGYEDTAAGLRYSGAVAKYGADEAAIATRFGSKTQAAATRYQGAASAASTRYGAATGANAALTAGENAKTASYLGAAGTILSGAGSIGKTYSAMSKPYAPASAYG